MKEIKILTPIGMLGYGIPEADYLARAWRGIPMPSSWILDRPIPALINWGSVTHWQNPKLTHATCEQS